jgi:hypothetical protein
MAPILESVAMAGAIFGRRRQVFGASYQHVPLESADLPDVKKVQAIKEQIATKWWE